MYFTGRVVSVACLGSQCFIGIRIPDPNGIFEQPLRANHIGNTILCVFHGVIGVIKTLMKIHYQAGGKEDTD
jgi:hypothetical protein